MNPARVEPSMRPLMRVLPALQPKYPMHVVQSRAHLAGGKETGLTISEENPSEAAANAEYEVLRAIVSREQYLHRLLQVVKTVGKTFKSEVVDVIDLVRMASLDVVEKIALWREAKSDPNATFIWNGVNYLLKMPSDLDFLADFLAIQRWTGFPLNRNPFCVPFPMDVNVAGAAGTDSSVDPKHMDKTNSLTEGFTIGRALSFEPTSKPMHRSATEPSMATSSASPYGMSSSSGKIRSMTKTRKTGGWLGDGDAGSGAASADMQSFIFNEDMRRIRRAERIIMKAEEQFGCCSRDPDGRLVPLTQALTRKAAVELKKDDRRPLSDASQTTHSYAPHALQGGIGMAETGWAPVIMTAQQQLDAVNERVASKYVREVDDTVNPKQRGLAKSGGELLPAQTRGTNSRPHKPIKASISSKVDFKRFRQIQSLGDRLEDIRRLKEELIAAKSATAGNGGDPTGGQNASLQAIRATLTNQSGVGGLMSPPKPTVLSLDTKQFPDGFLSNLNPDSKPLKKLDYSKVIGEPADEVALYDRSADPSSAPPSRDGPRKGRLSSIRSPARATPEPTSALAAQSASVSAPASSASFDESVVKRTVVEEAAIRRKLNKLTDEERITSGLKKHEVKEKGRERSRDIERKRRLLGAEESKSTMVVSEDEPNVYDFYATRIQSTVRGWIVRRWVAWYREVSAQAAIVVQSIIRGWLARSRVRRMRLHFRAATLIQKNFRGWHSRGTSSAMAKRQNLTKNAITIQRVWRGVLGKRRMLNKRDLDKAAKQAFDAVDAASLVASDVKELAFRIIYAIEEPSSTSFPPDEVLFLLRQTVLIIQSARGYLGLADYDFFNARHYDEINGEEMDWRQAGKVVNRSETFIRLIRALAYGPGAKPPRLIQIPNAVNVLYSAQVNNPRWAIHTFDHMGKGSRICCQLFKWLTAMIEISDRQQQFLSLIASSFPDWLPKMNELQQGARLCEFEIELNKRTVEVLAQHKATREGDEEYLAILEKEVKIVKRAANDAKGRLRHIITEISKLKNDQSTREMVALTTIEAKLGECRAELDELAKALQETTQLADQGDRAAKELVQELKLKLTNQKLKTSELDGQRKLLELQVESNKAKRRADARLASNTIMRTNLAGEAKAAYVIAQVDALAMLRASGVKHATDLPSHLAEMYEPLQLKEGQTRSEARLRFLEAEKERKNFEDYLGRSLVDNDMKEQKSKSKMTPTEQELEEERIENEQEAVQERRKHMQYLPDAVLHTFPKRPRPVIIALARDLPGPVKKKICQQVISSMPGTFIYLDTSQNYGMDVDAIQNVITAGQCAIVSVDHGLTRATRDSFNQALDLTLHALVPTPLIALAIGSDKNIRGGAHASDCGVDKDDLRILRDSRLKVCMETMAWLVMDLQSLEMKKLAMVRASETVPSSQALALVMEACFLFYSDDPAFSLPHSHRHPLTWPKTRKLLLDLGILAEKMSTTRRGASSLGLVNCIQQYFSHTLWPSSHDEERANDVLLHSLATLLEQFVECEVLCVKGGGAPPQAFTKSSVRGIQSVVVVCDEERSVQSSVVRRRKNGVYWIEASALLVKAALEDLRVVKTVVKIDQEPHMVSVYRDQTNIFFEAYHSSTSRTFVTTVSAYDVPSMLVPNGSEQGSSSTSVVPETPMKMYERMLTLLKFRKTPVSADKQLLCRRDYAFLQQFVGRVDGHLAVIKCFEAALGELFFTAYLPQQCAYIELLVGTSERLALIRDAEHRDVDPREFEIAQAQDSRPMLPYIVDRLRIYPTVSMFGALYPHISSRSQSSDFRLNGYPRQTKHQGFQLKARVHGGTGKVLFRRALCIMGVRYVLEGRLSSPSKLLVLKAYEPVARKTLRYKMPVFLRRALLGWEDEDWRKWLPSLVRRLRVDWRGGHELTLDRQLVSRVVRIANKRLLCCVLAVDEASLEMRLLEPGSSQWCSCVVEEKQALALLAIVSNLSAAGATPEQTTTTQRSILHALREPHDSADQALLHRDSGSSAHSADLTGARGGAIESILKDPHLVHQLMERLTSFLVPLDPKSMKAGFMTARCPVTIKFQFRADQELRIQPLETSLRQRPHIIPQYHPDQYDGRIQPPVVFLESELDQLAFQRAQAADFFGAQMAEVSQGLSEHIDALGPQADQVVDEVTKATADAMMDAMQERIIDRLRERAQPGHTQQQVLEQRLQHQQLQQQLEQQTSLEREQQQANQEICEGTWRVALEMGLKSNFREAKVRWQGHIAVKVLETNSWIGSEGMGKCYKFIVYEPNCAQQFEGLVRSKKHLIEVLGARGRDLLDINKEKEMLIFISRYRLEVVTNKYDALGELTGPDAPPYRIEFITERIYTQDKVTPINAEADEDEEVNGKKLMEIENARGRKIMRLVRRVSGILMQLTVFELPQAVADAAMTGYIPVDPALLGIDISIPALAQAVTTEHGYAEVRTILRNLQRHNPPAFRVVGYDPKSKRKVVLAVQPQTVLEVAGGIFSPYLDPDRRKDLAKVLCDALILFFPSNQPFELTVPWSGAKEAISTAEVARDKKVTNRSSADRVMQRKGRIFRSVMRISKYDLVVSVFVLESELNTTGGRLIFNFYSPSVSEAAEISVDDAQQTERLSKPVVKFPEGSIRAAAIRRFCRSFRAEIIEDILDPTHRVLNVVLLPPDKAYVAEYIMVKVPPPGENLRPVGLPGPFFPLDTVGKPLHRRGMTLYNQDPDAGGPPQKDFLVTVFTKSATETPERGLVLQLYDRALSETSVLHLGPSELMRICKHADEPDLLGDIVLAQVEQEQFKVDAIETGFKEFTTRGELETKTTKLVDIFIDIVLRDLAYFVSPQETIVPCIVSSPKGVVPL